MKKLFFMMSMLSLLSFVMTGCSSDDDSSMSNNERKDISITRSEESLVHQNNDFSFRLLRTVQGEESQILSPLIHRLQAMGLSVEQIAQGADMDVKEVKKLLL